MYKFHRSHLIKQYQTSFIVLLISLTSFFSNHCSLLWCISFRNHFKHALKNLFYSGWNYLSIELFALVLARNILVLAGKLKSASSFSFSKPFGVVAMPLLPPNSGCLDYCRYVVSSANLCLGVCLSH